MSSETAFVEALDDSETARFYNTDPERIGPLNSNDLRLLGFDDIGDAVDAATLQTGRPTTIMIFPDNQSMYGRNQTVPLTTRN